MGFTRNELVFCSIAYFGFMIVKGCSNPLATPGSDILRQSPKEEFQPEVEQIGSRDRVPKSGHKYCHVSQQIWMYCTHKKNTIAFFQHDVEKKQEADVNILPQIQSLDKTLILSEPVRQIQDFRKTIDL